MSAPITLTLSLSPDDVQWLIAHGYAELRAGEIVLGQASEDVMRALLMGAVVYADGSE